MHRLAFSVVVLFLLTAPPLCAEVMDKEPTTTSHWVFAVTAGGLAVLAWRWRWWAGAVVSRRRSPRCGSCIRRLPTHSSLRRSAPKPGNDTLRTCTGLLPSVSQFSWSLRASHSDDADGQRTDSASERVLHPFCAAAWTTGGVGCWRPEGVWRSWRPASAAGLRRAAPSVPRAYNTVRRTSPHGRPLSVG
jgi:hypothetical protein